MPEIPVTMLVRMRGTMSSLSSRRKMSAASTKGANQLSGAGAERSPANARKARPTTTPRAMPKRMRVWSFKVAQNKRAGSLQRAPPYIHRSEWTLPGITFDREVWTLNLDFDPEDSLQAETHEEGHDHEEKHDGNLAAAEGSKRGGRVFQPD